MKITIKDFVPLVDIFKQNIFSLQSGVVPTETIASLNVAAYNSHLKLQEVATISIPQPRVINIKPWDTNLLKSIFSALEKSELNLSPVIDKDFIRINFPPMTEEKRQQLVKILHQRAEEVRVQIRKKREELIKNLKQQEKNHEISEDDFWRGEKQIQEVVDEVIGEINTLVLKKEKDLMTI